MLPLIKINSIYVLMHQWCLVPRFLTQQSSSVKSKKKSNLVTLVLLATLLHAGLQSRVNAGILQCKGLKLQAGKNYRNSTGSCLCTQRTVEGNGYVTTGRLQYNLEQLCARLGHTFNCTQSVLWY